MLLLSVDGAEPIMPPALCEWISRVLKLDFRENLKAEVHLTRIHLRWTLANLRKEGYPLVTDPSKEVNDMPTLPTMIIGVLAPFAPLFSERVFEHAQVLVAGAVDSPQIRGIEVPGDLYLAELLCTVQI